MLTKKFEWRHDEDFGGEGWAPVEQPTFNVCSPLMIAHDTLEHFPKDKGDIEAELHALGAMLLIRGESGWFYANGNRKGTSYNLSADLSRFLINERNETYILPKAGEKKLSEDFLDMHHRDVQEACRLAVEGANSELYEDDFNFLLADTKGMAYTLMIGYEKARKRYKGLNSCELSYLFDEIMKQTKDYTGYGEFGMQMTVSVNLKACSVNIKVKEPYER